jgi:hypothetical protein
MHRARVILEALLVTLAVAWFVWFFRHDLGWAFPAAIVLVLVAIWIVGVLEERDKRRAREANQPADASPLLRAVRGATGPIGDVLTTISGTGIGIANVTAKADVTFGGLRGPTGPHEPPQERPKE